MRGKRRLAYQISKHKEGIYVQLSHTGNGQQVAVLEKAMRLSEDVIRYLTVKQEGPLPTPRVVTNNETDTEEKKGEEKESLDNKKDEGKENSDNKKEEGKESPDNKKDEEKENSDNKKDEEIK